MVAIGGIVLATPVVGVTSTLLCIYRGDDPICTAQVFRQGRGSSMLATMSTSSAMKAASTPW